MNERDDVAVTFNLNREEIIFISVYLSPNEDITGNLLTLGALLTKHSDKKVIVAGDFDAKSRAWGPTTNARGEVLLNFFAQHDLDVVNDPNGLPTFNSILGQSWVDLFITNIKELAQYEVHDNISCSDHALITVGIDRSEIIQKTRQCNIKFERLDWLALRMKLRDIIEMHDLSLIETPEQVENSIVRITEDVVNACNASKLKSVAGRRRHSSWWHSALGQMRRHVRALRRRYQRTVDDQERVKFRIEFKRQLSIYKKSIRKAKITNLKLFLDKVNENGAFSAPYRIAKGEDLRAESHKPVINEICIPASSFEETIQVIMSYHFPNTNYDPGNPLLRGFDDPPFTDSELEAIVNDFKCNKAPGPDGLLNEIF
nr:uncharacterized protein LOC122271234 [Parasteatoda tepidariorum]